MPELRCLDLSSWRAFSQDEVLAHVQGIYESKKDGSRKGCLLAVRRHLSPLDMYCYLKARFGEPNGFQNVLRKDDSENLIHWDFNLWAGAAQIYICGMGAKFIS